MAGHEVKPAGALLDNPQLQFAPVERVAAIAGLSGKIQLRSKDRPVRSHPAVFSLAFTSRSICSTPAFAAASFSGSRERTTILVFGPVLSSKNG